jgi:phosphatidylinositol-3,4,5-trisphosphate 3-phosphatase/dual-specificity protein phosphatase PTEN
MATTAIRKIASKKKRRFESEGFNLDLSYVTERVIAMGYPASEHVEAMYRNAFN